ncbi:helix-turn-helix domain-containing protein [Streptomyces sp. NBC_01462]|uniref:helix-turn-helix domain-containing protein n=1 Tax=Streptomyces sp. NBC_01462 TaxID=2903876 RepID=UPI002E341B62|nr:XRE family transcriptional regulator [Streptomyces sp. NBC_01462]
MTKAIPLWQEAEVEIFGERLRDARLIQRLRSGDVAKEAGVSQSWYSKVEHTVSTMLEKPKAQRLASALNFSIDFLSATPVTQVQRGSLLFRAKKSLPKSEEDQLVSWARLVGDLVHSAEPKLRLPYLRVPRIPSDMSPIEAAQIARKSFGIESDAPVPHLIRTLERGGVYVATIDFEGDLHARNHDAFSTWIGLLLDRPLVGVRATDSWERTRLSIAHELGHLAMHHTRREGELEREAYTFGAEFLLPQHVLEREWPETPTLMSLLPLKRVYGMSLSSLIEHGYRTGLLSGWQRTNLYKQLSNRRDHSTGERLRVREPGWRDREVERPKLLATVAEKAFGKSVTVDSLGEQIFSWRPDLVRQLLEGQVTDWARDVTRQPEAADAVAESHLAEVVQLHGARRGEQSST